MRSRPPPHFVEADRDTVLVDKPVTSTFAEAKELAALAKAKEFSALLDQRLAEDAGRRDGGGLIAELSAENDRDTREAESVIASDGKD